MWAILVVYPNLSVNVISYHRRTILLTLTTGSSWFIRLICSKNIKRNAEITVIKRIDPLCDGIPYYHAVFHTVLSKNTRGETSGAIPKSCQLFENYRWRFRHLVNQIIKSFFWIIKRFKLNTSKFIDFIRIYKKIVLHQWQNEWLNYLKWNIKFSWNHHIEYKRIYDIFSFLFL